MRWRRAKLEDLLRPAEQAAGIQADLAAAGTTATACEKLPAIAPHARHRSY